MAADMASSKAIEEVASPLLFSSAPQAIGIAGAGLAGRLLAWRLAMAGHKVSLFDVAPKDSFKPAAMVAAAMLAPVSEALVSDELVYHLGLRSLALWPEWLQELQSQTGESVYYQQKGSMIVAHQQDAAELRRFEQRVKSKSFIEASQLQQLDSAGLSQLEPDLAHFERGCFLPAEACLHNWQLFSVLGGHLEELVDWQAEVEVTEVNPYQLMVDEKVHHFDLVLDCRGIGAKKDLEGLRGVRGEVLWVEAPEVSLGRPVRLMHPRYQLYIAPKTDSLYVIGATEIESESMAPVSVRSSLELLSALYAVNKGFAEAKILHSLVNLRPAFFDNQPKVISQPGLVNVNGFYRHGFLIGPAVVESVLSMLQGGEQRFTGVVKAA